MKNSNILPIGASQFLPTKIEKFGILGSKELAEHFEKNDVAFYHIDEKSMFFKSNERWVRCRTSETSKKAISLTKYLKLLNA